MARHIARLLPAVAVALLLHCAVAGAGEQSVATTPEIVDAQRAMTLRMEPTLSATAASSASQATASIAPDPTHGPADRLWQPNVLASAYVAPLLPVSVSFSTLGWVLLNSMATLLLVLLVLRRTRDADSGPTVIPPEDIDEGELVSLAHTHVLEKVLQ